MKKHVTFAMVPVLIAMSIALASAEQRPPKPEQMSHVVAPVQKTTVPPVKEMSTTSSVRSVPTGKMSPMLIQGHTALVNQQYAEAAQAFQAVLSTDPNNVRAMNELCLAMMNQSQYDEALKVVNKAITLDPVNSRLFFTKAQILDAQNKPMEAIDAYLTFTSLSPEDGAALMAQRRSEELYKDVSTTASASWINYVQGLRLMSMKQPEQAIPIFEKFKAMEPNNQQAHMLLGRAYLESGQPEKAIPCFEMALKTQSDNPMAYYQLGSSYEQRGEMKNAQEAFRKFVQIAPQSEVVSRLNRMMEISKK